MLSDGWIMSQNWHDVLFIHCEASKDLIQKLTPFPLDLYQNRAIISIVPFKMSGIRFAYLPSVPGLSSLWELNLRTYVDVGGQKGVYFFSLDTNSVIGNYIARRFFHLPYHYSQISAKVSGTHYQFNHKRKNWFFNVSAEISEKVSSTEFDLWATERYSLFTFDHDSFYEGKVHHRPWNLQQSKLLTLEDSFSGSLGDIGMGSPLSVSYSKKLEVSFTPFKKIGSRHA